MGKYKINELLKERNLSISELADYISVDHATLKYNLEHDKVSVKHLVAIANALIVDVSDLFNENYQEPEINGTVINGNKTYDFSNINDLAAYIDELAKNCNIKSY
jgi:transcriptional regulator with XRE-family HTH domain